MGDIYKLESFQEDKELSQEEVYNLQSLTTQIHQIFKKEEIMRRQRVRINWIKQRDLNITFFHKTN